MKNSDILGVLFCLFGLAAGLGAWRVFLDRSKQPVPNFPSQMPKEPRGLLWSLVIAIFFIFEDYPGRRPDGPIGWLSTFVALVLISAIFLLGGVYLGLQ